MRIIIIRLQIVRSFVHSKMGGSRKWFHIWLKLQNQQFVKIDYRQLTAASIRRSKFHNWLAAMFRINILLGINFKRKMQKLESKKNFMTSKSSINALAWRCQSCEKFLLDSVKWCSNFPLANNATRMHGILPLCKSCDIFYVRWK